MKNLGIYLSVVFLGLCVVATGYVNRSSVPSEQFIQPNQPFVGSVSQANEYHATTTYQGTALELQLASTTGDIYAVKKGSLGSVVITKVGTASFDIYDATTTNVNLRQASMTTNTIRLASFPASVATGTYTFDEAYVNGLIVVYSVDNIPTSTITYR